jgi:hypothetical protein
MAPSKTFNLAGLQCSIAIIPNRHLRQQYRHATQGLVSWVNLMGLTAALAAYCEGQEWLDQLLVYLEANRDFLYEFVRAELHLMARPGLPGLAGLQGPGSVSPTVLPGAGHNLSVGRVSARVASSCLDSAAALHLEQALGG